MRMFLQYKMLDAALRTNENNKEPLTHVSSFLKYS